jgi:hypothetical protein
MARHGLIWMCALCFALLVTLACASTATRVPATQEPAPTYTPYPTLTPYPTQAQEPAATTKSSATTSTGTEATCMDPREVTASDKGTVVEVCGKIIDEGTQDCPDCPYGVLDYVTFEGGFNVISYYWNFYSYEGLCLQAKDTVELMGSRPIFVYGAREGYAGSKCAANSDGSLNCDSGDYFLLYEGCD